jgi:hypothetical protein
VPFKAAVRVRTSRCFSCSPSVTGSMCCRCRCRCRCRCC